MNRSKEINKNRRIALVVGGTGLYFKALTDGLSEIPNVPKTSMNLKLDQDYVLKNPRSFRGIPINDKQRLQRALSVYKHTGKPLWMWQKKNKKNFKDTEFIKIFLLPDKQEIEIRIKKRFEEMLREGAIKEAEKFKKIKVNSLNSSNFIIGLKEISEFLSKKISLNELKEKVVIRSRQYAKRQATWARSKMVTWNRVDPKDFQLWIKKIYFSNF